MTRCRNNDNSNSNSNDKDVNKCTHKIINNSNDKSNVIFKTMAIGNRERIMILVMVSEIDVSFGHSSCALIYGQ